MGTTQGHSQEALSMFNNWLLGGSAEKVHPQRACFLILSPLLLIIKGDNKLDGFAL